MTLQLSHTLHDMVDGDGDAPFEVGALTTRIRRRRVVRQGARGAVAAGAVGVVALGLTRGTWDGGVRLPSADPDAAPGTCGSDVAALPTADADAPAHAGPDDDVNAGLGPLLGRKFSAGVLVTGSSSAVAGIGTGDLVAQRDALEETRRRGTDSDGNVLDDAALAAIDNRIGELRSEINAAGIASGDVIGSLGLRLVVAHDGTVVSTPAPQDDPYSWVAPDTGGTYVMLTGGLLTCTRAADPLPAGQYQAYATFLDPATGAVTVAGSWPLDLLPAPTRMVGLPADFPADVPLLGGRLITAHKDDDAWVAEVGVDAVDNVNAAAHLIVDEGAGRPSGPIENGIVPARISRVETPDWHVEISQATTPDGQSSVLYRLTPQS
ncbi:hypothetical protein Cch01nite_28820 [Cellulomonas chitinilytica]|uniref:Uncharacterized protein n=1 Tax=Cellulomonas chitinilytica TaxID=398759 RepID=A0A919P2P1_9CELL|nr:hypothetical protein [Cellulomonas chitinilytica]GIG22158.1 hypothetical protein Cch01nite_28820 [Cellulomonas chitinilytica]